MSPVSVLPGRIRLESACLLGNGRKCRYLIDQIRGTTGVTEVSVNSRTGRILITFNETFIDRQELISCIRKLMEDEPRETGSPVYDSGSDQTGGKSIVGHILLDAVAHAILPRPLHILVPAAIHTVLK